MVVCWAMASSPGDRPPSVRCTSRRCLHLPTAPLGTTSSGAASFGTACRRAPSDRRVGRYSRSVWGAARRTANDTSAFGDGSTEPSGDGSRRSIVGVERAVSTRLTGAGACPTTNAAGSSSHALAAVARRAKLGHCRPCHADDAGQPVELGVAAVPQTRDPRQVRHERRVAVTQALLLAVALARFAVERHPAGQGRGRRQIDGERAQVLRLRGRCLRAGRHRPPPIRSRQQLLTRAPRTVRAVAPRRARRPAGRRARPPPPRVAHPEP